MHETFEAVFELDEEAEIGLTEDLAGELAARGVALVGVLPGVGLESLHRERDAVSTLFDLGDLDLSLRCRPARRREASRRACDSAEKDARGLPSPPRSTKAPKSVMEVTLPVIGSPLSTRSESVCRSCLRCSLRMSARETTTRLPASLISMTRKVRLRSTYEAAFFGLPSSICDLGQKAGVPPRVTWKPPLFQPMTLPSTGILLSIAA